MDKRTRSLRALEGADVDRPPIFLYRHFKELNDDNSVADYIQWARSSGVDMFAR